MEEDILGDSSRIHWGPGRGPHSPGYRPPAPEHRDSDIGRQFASENEDLFSTLFAGGTGGKSKGAEVGFKVSAEERHKKGRQYQKADATQKKD